MRLPKALLLSKDSGKESVWLAALSGGADSVALSLLMKQEGINLYALHCNFHLRGNESDRDEAFVRDFCRRNEIPLEVMHFDTRAEAMAHKESIEMAARRLRYTWFARRAKELDAEGICVAHHMDDQAETILLNMIRGTGIQGLQGMQQDRMIGSLRVVRPLLGVTRKEIIEYLESQHQTYVTDSSNMERDAMRNRIRLDLMPLLKQLNPNITECLARTARNLTLTQTGDEEADFFTHLRPLGFSRSQILDIYAHKDSDGKGRLWHSATHTATVINGELVVEKAEDAPALPTLNVEEVKDIAIQKGIAYVDADTIRLPLTVRRMQAGDRFRPYGMRHGSKLLSDFLTDRKVNILEKKRQAVVTDQTGAIVWVAPYEIDDRYKISDMTARILRLSLK